MNNNDSQPNMKQGKKINSTKTNSKVFLESDPLEKPFHAQRILKENLNINYMAKDYDSFRNALMELATQKFPDWHQKSVADMRMVLIDIFSYVADELSYYQDRVANEAFLRTARKRSSVSSLLSLIDYNLHNGCTSQTFLTVLVNEFCFIPKNFQVSNKVLPGHKKIVFETNRDYHLDPKQNEIKLFFNQTKNLARGSTSAIFSGHYQTLKKGDFILFEKSGNYEIVCLNEDPVLKEISSNDLVLDNSSNNGSINQTTQHPVTYISWSRNDYLRNDYDENSTIFANILKVTQGQTIEKREILKSSSDSLEKKYQLKQNPIAFVSDSLLPYSAKSTVQVWVDDKQWKEVHNILEMSPYEECFSVSIDDEDFGTVLFGDGIHGKKPFPWSTITTSYKIGLGSKGNVGSKILTEFDRQKFPSIRKIINPISAKGGIDKQSIDDAKIMGPKTLRIQERAVTPNDYSVLIKNNFPEISDLQTKFSHNGSWNTLEISLDMKNNQIPDTNFLIELKSFINKIKMIGYDTSITLANYVYPEIEITIFLEKGFAKENVEPRLKFLLGNKQDETGQKGFFHPDNFTFGDAIHLSKIYEIIENVNSVEHGIVTKFKKFNSPYIPTNDGKDQISKRNLKLGFISVDEGSIVRLDNNPLYPEYGTLALNFVEQGSEISV